MWHNAIKFRYVALRAYWFFKGVVENVEDNLDGIHFIGFGDEPDNSVCLPSANPSLTEDDDEACARYLDFD